MACRLTLVAVFAFLGCSQVATASDAEWRLFCTNEGEREALRKQIEGRDLEEFDTQLKDRCPRIDLPAVPIHEAADASPEASHTNWVYDARYSPDGRTIVSASRDGSVALWDVETGAMKRRIVLPTKTRLPDEPVDGYVRSAVFLGDGRLIAAAKDHYPIQVHDAATGERTSELDVGLPDPHAFAPAMAATASRLLFLAGEKDTVDAIDVGIKAVRYTLAGHGRQAVAVAVSEVADLVATTSSDPQAVNGGHATVWRFGTGEKLFAVDIAGAEEPGVVAFSRDGALLAIATSKSGLILYSIAERRVTRTIAIDRFYPVYGLAFTADGAGLLACRSHPELYDVASGQRIRDFGPFNDLCHSVDVSPDGKFAITTSMASDVKMWDIATGAFYRRLGIDTKPPR